MVTAMLLEREAELHELDGLLAGLDSSGGSVVLIRGEAGIGKSALVHRFIETHRSDTYVHYGTCDDLLIPQALGPFWDIAREEPSLREPLERGDRPGLLNVVLGLLSRHERPAILVIEDTHWADEASLDAIRYVGRRIARTNALLVLTYRDGELDYDHPLRGVIGDIPARSVARIQLAGLTLAAVSQIVGASALDPAEVFSSTDGNPLLVTEMASSADEAVPASLQETLVARVQKLSIESQDALKTLALLPEPIPVVDALRIAGVTAPRLDECEQRGLLDQQAEMVAFRHELIRRTIESTLTASERRSKAQATLEGLSDRTHPALLVHCAVEANDVDRLLDLGPRSARYAAAAGGHRQAVRDFREIGPHLDRIDADELGSILDDWAYEEFVVDDTHEAIRLGTLARDHYRQGGDRTAESRALASLAHYHETAGDRDGAEVFAREAVDVLGSHPASSDLAKALEVNAYLQMMAGNATAALELVDRTLAAGGADIDENTHVRVLNHKGVSINVSDYPSGLVSVDEARERAEAAELWYEEGRALTLNAWACAEWRDLQLASAYVQRAITSAERHDVRTIEVYAKAIYSRVLELSGDWDEAADIARGLLDAANIARMVALPIVGAIESRKGRSSAGEVIACGWEMASATDEVHRLAPAAIAAAEHTWLTGKQVTTMADLQRVMVAGIELGFRWTTGRIASWLWELGELSDAPEGIAEPYDALIGGDPARAATEFGSRGMPYERALALMHGSEPERLEALEAFETLGASAVAARLRQTLRAEGVAVPRGKGRATRRHAAGLTARQAEVLQLLDEGASNTEIADRLFISPRTVENHVSAILDKLDVSTREEAIEQARRTGLLVTTA